ncbi:hypothetical protein GCM10009702_20610 [Propioniferax innocua]
MRHEAQNPVVRPRRPSRERPTLAPQLGQNLLRSGTTGSVIMAFSGSTAGAGGTRVNPAPIRADRSREASRMRRVDSVPTIDDPSAVDAMWLDALVTEDRPASSSTGLGAVPGGEPQMSQ